MRLRSTIVVVAAAGCLLACGKKNDGDKAKPGGDPPAAKKGCGRVPDDVATWLATLELGPAGPSRSSASAPPDRLALDLLAFITSNGDGVPAPRPAAATALAVTLGADPDASPALACARGAVAHAAPGEVLVTGELRGTSWGHGYVHEDRGIHAAVAAAQAVRLFAIGHAP